MLCLGPLSTANKSFEPTPLRGSNSAFRSSHMSMATRDIISDSTKLTLAIRAALSLKAGARSLSFAALITASLIVNAPATSAPAGDRDLEAVRRVGDLRFERRHAWSIVASLASSASYRSKATFESWYGEGEVFAANGVNMPPKGIRGFSRPVATTGSADPDASQSAGAPALTYTLYNEAAYNHIRRNHLYDSAQLERLRVNGAADSATLSDRTVPSFPRDSIVVKTIWWPVAPQGVTALPVWDPETNPPRREGNGYLTWARIVVVDPSEGSRADAASQVEFAGRLFANARRISLGEFYHISVDDRMAEDMMRDPETKKAAVIALGRPMRAGDYLILVAGNLATREISDWIWVAFWWHDRPERGAFAADRPDVLQDEWRNYLLQVAFDSETPAAGDGGPHVCFNPWLEARFRDAGQGGGAVSNCMTCHRRASYPPIGYLPVTRGVSNSASDPAFAAGRLRTSFLWSLAIHALP